MHRYLRAVGFSRIKSRSEINELLAYIVRNADEKKYTSIDDTDVMFAEYSKEFAENVGLIVRGEYNEDNQFMFHYYLPYMRGIQISSYEDISIERHAEKEGTAHRDHRGRQDFRRRTEGLHLHPAGTGEDLHCGGDSAALV